MCQRYLEDGMAPVGVGAGDADLAVEAPRAHEGGVQEVGPVGGCDEDDAVVGREAVHLAQQLIEGLLPLLIRPLACAGGVLSAELWQRLVQYLTRVRFLLFLRARHSGEGCWGEGGWIGERRQGGGGGRDHAMCANDAQEA